VKQMLSRSGVAVVVMATAVTVSFSCGGADTEQVSCERCVIAIDSVATIGDASGDGMLPGRPAGVLQDGAGRYWINVLDAIPVIHDPGDTTLRPIGRRGSGPGEFSFAAVHAPLPGDSMLVSNSLEFRVMAPDLTVARSVRSTRQLTGASVLQWPGRVLAVSRDRSRAPATPVTVVAIYDMTADTVAAVDTLLTAQAQSADPAAYASSLRRPGLPSADGGIWVSDYNSYRLVRYSPEGEPVDSVVRSPVGFPGGEALGIGGPDQPASPHMIGNWVDDEDRLWIVRAVPRADTGDVWAEHGDMRSVGEVRVSTRPADYELKRTIIEVLDPRTKRLLARQDFDGFIFAVLPDSHVASFVETDVGVPIITIHRLRLIE
jgi:hypothetical protein